MLLRNMSSNPERPRESANNPGTAASHSSLNSFVVNNQTPNSYAKLHRRAGLPRGRTTGSTGNLLASSNIEPHHSSRLSFDADASRALPLNRSSSAQIDLQGEWAAMLERNGGRVTPPPAAAAAASQTLHRPVTAPSSGLLSTTSAPPVANEIIPVQSSISRQLSLEKRPPKPDPERTPTNDAAAADAQNGTAGVPVFVMMPLDTVNAEGIFRHSSSRWFHQALEKLASSGVHGIAIDVWWGAVERQPMRYDWSGYCQLFELAKSMGLKIQAVLSFHACGGNVGDSAQIPLPKWVLQVGENDPDIFFTDRPRESRGGQRNREYLSFWADEAPRALCGRSPLDCYTDFMRSFRGAFFEDIGNAIEEVVIGCGPCGELRYASYPETNGWRFPGVGEFQCYDRRALASLAVAAEEAGHPEWGHTGPHDSGEYNSNPEETGFFCGWGGSWDTEYGHFFLEWYSKSLIDHGDRLLRAATTIFNFRVPGPALKQRGRGSEPASGSQAAWERSTVSGQDVSPLNSRQMPVNGSSSALPETVSPDGRSDAASLGAAQGLDQSPEAPAPGGEPSPPSSNSTRPPNEGVSTASSYASLTSAPSSNGPKAACSDRRNGADNTLLGWPRLRPAGSRADGRSISLASLGTEQALQAGLPSARSEDGEHRATRGSDTPQGNPVGITLKVAGVHWWYRTRAHAAELTAGYFNAGERDGYRDIIDLCAKYNATFTLTCVEMCDSQHPPEALCSPEGLLRQVRELAAELRVEMGGENALPCFSPQHIDIAGLDRIAYNSQPWAPPLQEEAAKEEALYNRHPEPGAADSPQSSSGLDPSKLGMHRDPSMVRSGKLLQSHLPTLRGLTFLRLSPEMMAPSYQGAWLRFMQRMRTIGI